MSIHIEARDGDIADVVLLPGDPLRAEHIANTFFENPVCYTKVRGMLGYTGTYRGKRVSVQGTGMGIPSLSIYVNELLKDYHTKTLIRVGTCGALQKTVHMRDVVLAMSASTDSAVNRLRFSGIDFAPTANFDLLYKAYLTAQERGIHTHIGPIFTSDTFYRDDTAVMQTLADFGTLAVEMETAALYTLAAKAHASALAILTVSDHVVTGETTTTKERQETFHDMVELALATAL